MECFLLFLLLLLAEDRSPAVTAQQGCRSLIHCSIVYESAESRGGSAEEHVAKHIGATPAGIE
jgi:hypothetical protein